MHLACLTASRTICRPLPLVLLFFAVLLIASPASGQIRLVTPEERLSDFGFDDTPSGLLAALQSDQDYAVVYALRIVADREDAQFAEQAAVLIKHENVRVQLEAAKVLAILGIEHGAEWMRKWSEDLPEDAEDIPFVTAHAVLDAASFLASRGDESLAEQVSTILNHESWSVKMHAARALRPFTNLERAETRAAWLQAVEVAVDAITAEEPPREDYLASYLRLLRVASLDHPERHDDVTAAFASLARIDHPATARQRHLLIQNWRTPPPVEAEGE